MAKRNKLKSRQRQSQRHRLLVIASVSTVAIVVGVISFLHFNKPEQSKAAVQQVLEQDALPTEMEIMQAIIQPDDTTNRQGRYKTAKSLSLTPTLPVVSK